MIPQIYFDRFPVPPSENAAYRRAGNHKGLYKTSVVVDYEKECDQWWMAHNFQVRKARQLLQPAFQDQNMLLSVDAWFGFHYDKLFHQNGKRKKIDVSNRIKVLHDNLARILQIDDCRFSVGQKKPLLLGSQESQCVIIRMTPEPMKMLKTLRSELARSIQLASSSSPVNPAKE